MPDVARVHDDEAVSRPCSRAHALSLRRGVIALVSTQFGITRTRSARAPFSSNRAAWSRRSRRFGPRGGGTGGPARETTPITTGFSRRLSRTAVSGKTSWLITTRGTRKRLARRAAQRRRSPAGRSSPARRRALAPAARRAASRRGRSRSSARAARAAPLERGRADAHDLTPSRTSRPARALRSVPVTTVTSKSRASSPHRSASNWPVASTPGR